MSFSEIVGFSREFGQKGIHAVLPQRDFGPPQDVVLRDAATRLLLNEPENDGRLSYAESIWPRITRGL